MIKYKLNCENCKSCFDSWFASSKEFEKLQKMNLINCHFCNSFEIKKSVMSPSVSMNIRASRSKSSNKYQKAKYKIKEFQNYIKKNFEYVGDNFSYEARSIHYGEKKSKKGIYGDATSKDIRELNNEGIETTLIPWINDKEN